MHFRGIGEDSARAVAQRRVVLPTAFPELVDNLHIFVGDVVAVVMPGLFVLAGAFRGAVEIAGDDVPADPSFGEMVERRHPPRERIGRLVGQVGGHAKAEMFGDRGHRRDQQQGIVGRRLRGIAQRRVGAAAEHVVDPEHVGKKQPVEPPAFQRFGQIGPVRQPVIFRGAVARMGPQPRRLMRDAVHGEGVQPDLFFHDVDSLGLRHADPPCYSPGWTFCRPERKVNDQSRRHRASAPATSFRRISRRARPQGGLSDRKPEPGSGEALRAYLEEELQPAFAKLGFSTRVIESPTGKGPYLLAEYHENPSARPS